MKEKPAPSLEELIKCELERLQKDPEQKVIALKYLKEFYPKIRPIYNNNQEIAGYEQDITFHEAILNKEIQFRIQFIFNENFKQYDSLYHTFQPTLKGMKFKTPLHNLYDIAVFNVFNKKYAQEGITLVELEDDIRDSHKHLIAYATEDGYVVIRFTLTHQFTYENKT